MSRCLNRVLVTGGAGFMGSAFIRLLLADPGFDGTVCNLDALTYAADLANLAEVENDTRYRFVRGDICDGISLQNFDVVVHFAAESHVDRSIECPRNFIETNIIGTYTLLEELKRFPQCHFHHVSTDEVYGSISEGVADEETPYAPSSPYAASKSASDHLVRSFAKTYGLKVTLSHATNNYGPGQHPEKFIPRMIQCLMEKKPLPIYGTGSNVRDWIYVEDHARAILTILKRGMDGEAYNVSAHNPMRNLDVVESLAQHFNEPVKLEFVPDRPGHDMRYALDASKLKALGWKPEVSFDEGIERTINYYMEKADASKNCLCHTC
ncbi:MAG: dTDP-glucose 4,6-dehydratase [Chlamydiales bacterium]|nr:dTDP-glucose 4,6-dehydratase [Chlamydiales bacterium]